MRYYDPEIGRFLNADDNLEGGLNLFAYCYNNPVNFVDYDGEFAVIATLGALTAADLIIGGGILVSGAAAIWSASPAGKKTINKLAQATDKAVRSAVQTVKTALTPAAPGKPDNNKDKNKKKDSAKSKNKAKNTNLKKISSNTEANKTAKKFDYKGAEDLKKDFVGKSNISKYNMMKDTKTGEIILQSISDSAKQITTGLFV